MLHFPSRTDSLNATQSKSHSDPLLLKIEEELHDARRVHSHGQEEDLRAALNMVIDRVVELTSSLSEAYKAQAELEVQLNVARSNLQLVISNNEMLEEALKRETKGHSQDVGWRRASGRDASISNNNNSSSNNNAKDNSSRRTASVSDERSFKSLDYNSVPSSPVVAPPTPTPTPTPTPAPAPASTASQDSRFFRFRFTGSSSSSSRPTTRPTTPSGIPSAHHLTSSSMPVLPTIPSRELEELASQLEKEKAAHKTIAEEKAALEAELEALSQALFEELYRVPSPGKQDGRYGADEARRDGGRAQRGPGGTRSAAERIATRRRRELQSQRSLLLILGVHQLAL